MTSEMLNISLVFHLIFRIETYRADDRKPGQKISENFACTVQELCALCRTEKLIERIGKMESRGSDPCKIV